MHPPHKHPPRQLIDGNKHPINNNKSNTIINNINKNKNFLMHLHYYYYHHINNNNCNDNNLVLADDDDHASINRTKSHYDTTNMLAAKLFASRGFRRRSYDDQEGDNDINIILQPSDLDDIEKQARAKYAQFKASSQGASRTARTTSNWISDHQSKSVKVHPQPSAAAAAQVSTSARATKLSDELEVLTKLDDDDDDDHDDDDATSAHRSPILATAATAAALGTTTNIYNSNQTNETSATGSSKRLKALTNIFQDIKLAKCLLDQDYNQTVRLFIKKSALNWNFNSFTFDALCCGRSLTELLLHLFDYYNLYNIFSLDIVKVLKCFRLLEFGYHSTNPYHNSVHAADVTQAMHCFIQENKIRRHMTNLEILCSILAAVCHDLDHPGVNQSFLVATKNPLASLYQNNSVLENHHWRFALCIFKESHIFEHFEQSILDDMKEQLKHLILATDIARQNEYLKRFRDLTSSHEFSMSNTDDRALVLQMALKCADLGNPCRPWLISRVWSNLICDEFYRMGQIERRLGVPLTPICQREKTSIAGIQTDFFRFIVLPLLELWHDFLESPLSNLLMSNFDHNYRRWQRANRIVQQLRRRKSIACLEPVEDASDNGSCADESPSHHGRPIKQCQAPRRVAAATIGPGSHDEREAIDNQPFFDPTMQTFCSKHSFVAIKRASSDYIKSGNGRLELLRDFQLNRTIEKSPLMARACKFYTCDKKASASASQETTTRPSNDCTRPASGPCGRPGGCSTPPPHNAALAEVQCGGQLQQEETTSQCKSDNTNECCQSSAAAKCLASSAATPFAKCPEQHSAAGAASVNQQQQTHHPRKLLSPIDDESGASPEVAASSLSPKHSTGQTLTSVRDHWGKGQEKQECTEQEQEDSASGSTPASRVSSACSSPVLMQRSVSSRASLAQEQNQQQQHHHHHHQKNLHQHIKRYYESFTKGNKQKLPPLPPQTTAKGASKYSFSNQKGLQYNSGKRRESDPGCPSDNYELAAAIVLLQYQNNTLFHKRRSSLPVCVPKRRSSK